jgi:hypothetical protein
MGMQQALMGGTYVDVITLTNESVTASQVGSPAVGQYRLNLSGLVEINTGGGFTTLETWLLNAANAGLYESRMTETIGTLTSGTVGVWQVLSTTRTWSLTQAVVGSSNCTATIEIRQASTLLVLATATIIFSSTRS